MPATPAWLASVEALLNRNIDGSEQAAALARRLRGTSLQIDVEGFSRIRASVQNLRLALEAGDDSAADALISGSPAALLQLLTGGTGRGNGRRAAQIRGDAEIADSYRELLVLARPDLEEELSRLVGDMPARRAAQFARQALAWARRTARTARENLAEYLQEESRDLVNQPEFEEFLRGVDEVREAADRTEARLAALERRVQGRA
jgi:ubiquinone biosynthesis accessory factor UbiJ